MEKEKDLQTGEREKNVIEEKTTAEYLFQEVAELVVNNFVATYRKEGGALLMRIPCGKTFKIIVQDA